MANILIRDIPVDVLEALKKRAKAHDRSLQRELRLILEEIARQPGSEIMERASEIRRKLVAPGRSFSDSGELQREDRSGERGR